MNKVLVWRLYVEVVMCVFRNKVNGHALWELGEEDNAASGNKME